MAGCSSTVFPALLCASVSPQHTEGCWGVGGARLPVQHHLGGRNGQQTLTPLSPCGFSRRAAPSTEGVKAPSTPPSPSPLLPRALPRVFPLPHLLCTPGSARPPPAAPAALCGDGEGVGRKRRRGADPKSAPPPPKTPLSAGPPTARAGRIAMDGTKGFPGMGGTGGTEAPTDPPPKPRPILGPAHTAAQPPPTRHSPFGPSPAILLCTSHVRGPAMLHPRSDLSPRFPVPRMLRPHRVPALRIPTSQHRTPPAPCPCSAPFPHRIPPPPRIPTSLHPRSACPCGRAVPIVAPKLPFLPVLAGGG